MRRDTGYYRSIDDAGRPLFKQLNLWNKARTKLWYAG